MTGKKMLDTILVGVMMLSTLGVIGLFYYTEKVYVKPPIDENKEKESLLTETPPNSLPVFFKVDKMIVSLTPNVEYKNERMRWLEIEVSFQLFKESESEMMKENLPMIQDKIISLTSKMPIDDLNSVSGKVLLEDRLKNAVNKGLGKKTVKGIYFTRFIVQ